MSTLQQDVLETLNPNPRSRNNNNIQSELHFSLGVLNKIKSFGTSTSNSVEVPAVFSIGYLSSHTGPSSIKTIHILKLVDSKNYVPNRVSRNMILGHIYLEQIMFGALD